MFAQREERDWSSIFWAAMLPICWTLAPVLGLLAQVQVRSTGNLGDKHFQTSLFLSIFLAMFGLMAMRILIGRALDERHHRQAYVLAAISLTCSAAMIVYGLNAIA
jgi:hypothetical protein